MKIELEEPFRSMYNCGYTYVDSENRKRVNFTSGTRTVSGMTYARYLMCVKLGYVLPTELEVDHRDDDKTKDDINNLQVLTREQNMLKEQYRQAMERTYYGYHCAVCDNPFILSPRDLNQRLAQGTELAYCSRSCAVKMQHMQGKTGLKPPVSEEAIQRIRLLRSQGMSSYKIADIVEVSRNTVTKYW